MPSYNSESSTRVESGVDWEQLTDEQRLVAASDASTMLVLGGAGVGKTTTALWAARRQLLGAEGGGGRQMDGQRVLFVTFSRTAVGQIRSRAVGVLQGISDQVEIVTFHGLAYRLLRSFGRYMGLPASLVITG